MPVFRLKRIAIIALALLGSVPFARLAVAQDRAAPPEPLPLDAALSIRDHNGRSPIDISPDGEWLLHTVATDETVARASRQYSATGVPFAEGDSRMQATATNTRTGEAVVLGEADSSSWAGTWSPDGTRVAFFSDAGGTAGVWIWDLASRARHRVGDVIARPFFGFGKPRWSPDGTQLMLVVVREGMTVADANALGRQLTAAPQRFPEVEAGVASVWVRSYSPEPEPESEEDAADAAETPAAPMNPLPGHDNDLAVIDLATGAARRIATNVSVRGYAFSPDGRQVAYSVLTGFEPATQQPTYDLHVVALESGDATRLGHNLRLGYGIEYSWSPDSSRVAWFPSGQMAQRAAADGEAERIIIADVATGAMTSIDDPEAPSFDPFDGENRPLWDAAGRVIYAIGGNGLWRADVATGTLRHVASVPGWGLRTLVYDWHADTVWSTENGNWVWTIARAEDGSASGIYAIDVRSGEVEQALAEPKTYHSTFNVDASDTGEIAFVASDQQSPTDLWVLDTSTRKVRRASAINPALDQYTLGEARLLHWRSVEGEELGGALLLPPGYQEGTALPLVVWVYGGSMGSNYVNRFGFWGDLPAFNMHLLATRGYAVLFPDAPIRVGSPARDLIDTVMPGVNAAIEAGYADPDRLAIMGQSYGSYNTLAMITQTTRFKAAVITAAVLHPDLVADYLAGFGGGTGYYEQGQGNMGGSIWEYPERYRENSPIFGFDRIETPLLVGQGENDGDLVPSDAIYTALERLDKPVEVRVYQGEGHVITQRANVLDFWERRLDFLAEHLRLDVAANGAVTPAEAAGH
jgi:dipeptidyl aminopeptidase/acylaminoacyl peptidase